MSHTKERKPFLLFSPWVLVQLIYDSIRAGAAEAAGFEDCLSLFPSFLVNERSALHSRAYP